jgi:uncharacterized protein YxeA
MKSTLTTLLGLVLLIGAAILAFSKPQDQPKVSKKTVMNAVMKATHKSQVSKEKKETQEPETVTVQFGLNANFGPKPETEQ